MAAQNLRLDRLKVGDKACFSHNITVADLDMFAALSGDSNPLHMNRQFSERQGYKDRVVHGAFFAGLVSRFVGMELPGQRSLLLSLKLDFVAPSFPGDLIKVNGEVDRIHEEQRVVIVKIRMQCKNELRVRASAMVQVSD